MGGLWGFSMWWLGAALFGVEWAGVFISLVSPILIVASTYLSYKKGMDQLAKYMQVGKVWRLGKDNWGRGKGHVGARRCRDMH